RRFALYKTQGFTHRQVRGENMQRKVTRQAIFISFTIAFVVVITFIAPQLIYAGCRDPDVVRNGSSVAYAASPDALIQYFGHNFFLIVTKGGTRIVADPLGPGWYPNPNVSADVVT